MSKMSDLDLMVREGERTATDFINRGIDNRTARAMAAVVDASNVEPEETAEEWLERMFEFEYCDECDLDAPFHTAVKVLGNWFAVCNEE